MVNYPGDLYIVATPIGNLGDMVPRGLEVLQRAHWIAAEDTRHSGRLLAHFDIGTPMLAYHDHSDDRQLNRILDLLAQGQDVALISDAGTPLISDPGYRLVREARKQGATIIPIPGCCAAIAALSAAGIPSNRFSFEGFLPAKQGQRQKALQTLRREPRTLIFYEAPHRILETLEDMGRIFGAQREAVVARELTKSHETFLYGNLVDLAAKVAADSNQQRGEIVIIVRGASDVDLDGDDQEQLRVLSILLEDLPGKQAAALAAKITGGNKKQLYQLAVELKNSV
ncbi:MAG: 16S rRNA (cytidine(1402)-2'-O)-methyltransferase [Porticoccaceae bacterium]|nr:16S rRNA (cytidine(1402)-2'-O)-methyltransferase [Porticoccaceae bacterium]